MTTRDELFFEIRKERSRQENKWGNDYDDTHTVADWCTIMSLNAARAIQGWKCDKDDPFQINSAKLRSGLVKVAAIIVAWIEAIDRQKEWRR